MRRGTERGDVGWEVPNPDAVDKNQEGYLGSKGSQPHTRPPTPGFQCQEDKSPSLLIVKSSGVWGGRRNCRILRSLLFKGLQ